MTGSWQILWGERAMRALTRIQRWQPLSSPFLFFPHFLILSQFLTHTFFLSHLLALSHTHTFLWKSQSHYLSSARVKGKRHQSLLIPRSFWGKVFPTGPSMQGNVNFSVCFCFLIWDDLFEESVIAIAMGIRELPVLMLIWQTQFFLYLDIWRQSSRTFSSTSLFYRNNLSTVRPGLEKNLIKTMKIYGLNKEIYNILVYNMI